jgi:putative ABC transport system ATP-binding protein
VRFASARMTAVMGPSGSGKSTLMHCIAGLDRVDSGEVWIGETRLGGLSEHQSTVLRRERIGFIFQSRNLVPSLSAAKNIVLPLRIAGKRPDREWYREVIDAVGLRTRLNHRPGELSGGEQQRVAAARALLTRPELILADEPTGSLDTKASAELLGFLRRSVDELGQTIIMVTHDPTAAAYADRVLFLADGRIVADVPNPTRSMILEMMRELGS